MTLEQFDEALLRWGPDLDRWPQQQQQAGQELLSVNAEAQSLLDEMTKMGVAIDATIMDETAAGVVSATVQQAIARRHENQSLMSLLPVGRILGWGSLAGIGGGAASVLLPVSASTPALLTIALGGLLP
ncbi:MAG: hypothetical protein WBN88_09030 [Anderseniella sp.]|jgi:hypothetical protein